MVFSQRMKKQKKLKLIFMTYSSSNGTSSCNNGLDGEAMRRGLKTHCVFITCKLQKSL